MAQTPDVVLLFTDVVLPGGMNGRKLDAGVQLIGKPFSFDELGIKVRQVLDRPTVPPAEVA